MGGFWQYHQTLKISLKYRTYSCEERHILINYSAPYWSKITKFIERPHDDVMELFTKFGYDLSKGCWEIGLLPVWRLCSRIWSWTNGLELEISEHHHLCRVSRWLDKICDRRGISNTTTWSALNSAWPKDSNDTCLWILDERFKSYKHKCMSNFDLLVALELMS